ncbi:hypothetical protein ACFL6M_00060 [Candidatus Eisenbacteria bacterium]|uniref:Right handed beta helix domain-containing protein n=1 Tax=Eiseniibacteriota bacterium TaxID=2212470 RepID=A0ABV6YIG0_UNCEI
MRRRSSPCGIVVYALIALCCGAGTATGTILHVPDPYPQIQMAINAAVDGDTVLVADGIYNENISYLDKNITVASHYLTTEDSTHIENTEIRPAIAGFPLVSITGGQSRHALLCGFTINGGMPPQGSGVYCVETDPTIAHNRILLNNVEANGGGIYVDRGGPVIRHNLIADN